VSLFNSCPSGAKGISLDVFKLWLKLRQEIFLNWHKAGRDACFANRGNPEQIIVVGSFYKLNLESTCGTVIATIDDGRTF
jgi:hypothetical protein